MNRFLLLLGLLLAQFGLFAQGTLHTYYNMNAANFQTYAKRTHDNGFIVAGNVGIFDQDAYVMKTDLFGNILWTRQIMRTQNQTPIDIEYNPVDSSYYILYTEGGYASYILKLNDAGQVIWDNQINIGMNLYLGIARSALSITSDNKLLITSVTTDASNTYHLGLTKLDSSGNSSWLRFYNIPNNSTFSTEVNETPDHNYILLGSVDTSYSNGNGNGRNSLIIKTDTAGNILWQQIYDFNSMNSPESILPTSDGGYLITGYQDVGSNQQLIVFKIDGLGNLQWNWARTGGNAYNSGYHAVENADGSFTVTGFGETTIPSGAHSIAFIKLSPSGSLLYSTGIASGQAVAHGRHISHNPNNGYAIFGTDGQGPFIITVDSMGRLFTNYVVGRAFNDLNGNCLPDNGEPSMPNLIVQIQKAGAAAMLANSGSSGYYTSEVDSGTYTINAQLISPYWQYCQNPQTVNFPGFFGRDTVDFPVSVLDYCTYMQVDVSNSILRRCMPAVYVVQYSNMGTITAQNAYVDVELDPYLNYDSCTAPLISQVGNTYRFDIGNVPMTGQGSFVIHVTVQCDSTVALGQVHCVEAHIYPDTICIPSYWPGSIIEAHSTCNNDSIVFTLENKGNGMANPRNYAIIEEHVMIQISPFQLGGGQSQQINIAAAPGAAYRIVAEQEDGFPMLLGDSLAVSSVIGCNTPPNMLTPNILDQFYNGDISPFVSVDCQPNRGAFDPNDKTGQPLGYGSAHYITKDIPLNYHVRFQNTGTDTAFRVMVIDTLSPNVEASSIRMGAASHPYTWELKSGGILVVYFNNIMLPDSNVNELASHGFFKFEIDQKANNSDGTMIYNQAAIYFDFNAPVFTNQTFHTIGSEFITVHLTGTENVLMEQVSVNVYPNPFESTATLEVSGASFDNLDLEIIDLTGRVLSRLSNQNGNRIQIDRAQLPTGMYLYRLMADGQLLNSGKIMVK